MTAEEAADVLAETYQASCAKSAFDFGDIGRSLGDAASAVTPHLQEAWKNPYIRNSLLAAGGGAALGAGRNLMLSPEERRRRSLSGDMLTGATLGGLVGAGGTLAFDQAPGLAAPAAENVRNSQEAAKQIASAKQPGAGVGDRFQAIRHILGTGDPAPAVAKSNEPSLWDIPGLMFPSPVGGVIGGMTGGVGGAAATQGLNRLLAPGAIRGAGRSVLDGMLGDKKPLIDKILSDKSPATNVLSRLKNWNRPATALGIQTPEELTSQLLPGTGASLDNIEIPLRAQAARARAFQSMAGPEVGIQAKAPLESTAKAIEDVGKQQDYVKHHSMSQQEAHTLGNNVRDLNSGRTGRFMRHKLLPTLGALGGFAGGSQLPVGPSFPSVIDHARRMFGGLDNAANAAVGTQQIGAVPQQPLPHWNPDDTAVGRDWYRGGAGSPF